MHPMTQVLVAAAVAVALTGAALAFVLIPIVLAVFIELAAFYVAGKVDDDGAR